MSRQTGNRITENAFNADDGKALIERALAEVKEKHGWYLRENKPIFSGVYYDSQKVGSFIVQATNDKGEKAVLKLQLRPLPYDEGMIIRHIQKQIKTPRIRLPRVYLDEPWNQNMGYGFLVMEDLADVPHLWPARPDESSFNKHEDFLGEFLHHVLPIEPFMPIPNGQPQDKYRDALDHFSAVAQASSHKHIDDTETEKMKGVYLEILAKTDFQGFHFTHGHLSGHEIHYDQTQDVYILFANLLWSFRPKYYELIFPLWVDLMGIRDVNVTCEQLIERIGRWQKLWENIQDNDPDQDKVFWFGILERSMMTTMLDLGASEWADAEKEQKQALLNAWKDLFHWVASHKF